VAAKNNIEILFILFFGNVKKKTTFYAILRLIVWNKIDISVILVPLNQAK
jgi:hypothetical protein